MTALRIALAATLAVLALAAVGCGSDDEDAVDDTTTTLTETTATDTTDTGSAIKGTVGPDFDISVDQTSVTAGSYELEVEDLSDIHNFHLTGPGEVDVATDVAGEGSESFTVELEAGTYTFVCDPHAAQMTGTIEVS